MKWHFDFRKNVHMYTHSLKCKSENYEFNCISEDMATESRIGFWIEENQISKNHIDDFINALENWAIERCFQYKIFLGHECLRASK